MLPEVEFPTFFIDLVGQPVSIKINQGERTFAFGAAVAEVSAYTGCCQWNHRTYADSHSSSYVPALSPCPA